MTSFHQASGNSGGTAQPVRVCALGFPATDMNLITSVVMLSQRRSQQLKLLAPDAASEADVFLVDSNSQEALGWIQAHAWVRKRCIIWVRSSPIVQEGEMVLHPPILWSQLPATIARALGKEGQVQAQGNVERHHAGVPPANGAAAEHMAQPRVLVVDDSPTVRQYLCSLLHNYDLDVTEAADGDAALAAMLSDAYDCVLLDVLMPGMDGYETCRKVKARAKAQGRVVAVIMLTSKGSPFDRIRGKMSGCDAYLTKPVGLDELLGELSKHVKLRT